MGCEHARTEKHIYTSHNSSLIMNMDIDVYLRGNFPPFGTCAWSHPCRGHSQWTCPAAPRSSRTLCHRDLCFVGVCKSECVCCRYTRAQYTHIIAYTNAHNITHVVCVISVGCDDVIISVRGGLGSHNYSFLHIYTQKCGRYRHRQRHRHTDIDIARHTGIRHRDISKGEGKLT